MTTLVHRIRFALDRLSSGTLVLLASACLVGIVLALGQATTYAWLSAFPNRAPQFDSLEWKFWTFVAIAGVLAFVDVVLFTVLILRPRRRPKTD